MHTIVIPLILAPLWIALLFFSVGDLNMFARGAVPLIGLAHIAGWLGSSVGLVILFGARGQHGQSSRLKLAIGALVGGMVIAGGGVVAASMMRPSWSSAQEQWKTDKERAERQVAYLLHKQLNGYAPRSYALRKNTISGLSSSYRGSRTIWHKLKPQTLNAMPAAQKKLVTDVMVWRADRCLEESKTSGSMNSLYTQKNCMEDLGLFANIAPGEPKLTQASQKYVENGLNMAKDDDVPERVLGYARLVPAEVLTPIATKRMEPLFKKKVLDPATPRYDRIVAAHAFATKMSKPLIKKNPALAAYGTRAKQVEKELLNAPAVGEQLAFALYQLQRKKIALDYHKIHPRIVAAVGAKTTDPIAFFFLDKPLPKSARKIQGNRTHRLRGALVMQPTDKPTKKTRAYAAEKVARTLMSKNVTFSPKRVPEGAALEPSPAPAYVALGTVSPVEQASALTWLAGYEGFDQVIDKKIAAALKKKKYSGTTYAKYRRQNREEFRNSYFHNHSPTHTGLFIIHTTPRYRPSYRSSSRGYRSYRSSGSRYSRSSSSSSYRSRYSTSRSSSYRSSSRSSYRSGGYRSGK